MSDKEFIPASLRIGASAAPRPEVPFDVLLRGINSDYAEWITNSPDWDRNDTRNLIITMKVALERMQQERDEARRIAAYQYAKHSNYGDESFAMRNFFQFHKWEYLKEDGK